MTRRRYEDDDREDRPARPRRSNTGNMALAIILGGGFLLLVVAGGCVGLIMLWGRGAHERERQEEVQARQLPTREEFRQKIMGKTADEVIAAVGRPASTTEGNQQGSSNWYFEKCSKDPVTGKADTWVQVIFEDGRVARINF